MKKRYGALIALIVAVVFGGLAVMFASKYMSSQIIQEKLVIKDKTPVAKIVVASQDINIGAKLNETNLTLANWPVANHPKGAFKEIDKVKDRVAVTRLVAGEPLLAAELAAPGSGIGLVSLIPQGKRAMSIKVDEVVGVSGFVLPNTFVDMIGVEGSQGKVEKAKTILKRIKVLAIAQETFTEGGKAKIVRTVTLELTLKQSEKLALYTNKGPVHLVLRNPLDEEKAAHPPPPPPQKSPPKAVAEKKPSVPVLIARVVVPDPSPFDVEIIRASKRQKIRFKNVDTTEIESVD